MMIALYPSKKVLKEEIGKALKYRETSMFGEEYKADGTFCVCNRPSITGIKNADGSKAKEFFAEVTMKNGLIEKVK